MFAKKKVVVQTLMALGILSVTTPVLADNGFFTDKEGNNAAQAVNDKITVNGNSYLKGPTYIYYPTVEIKGDLLRTTQGNEVSLDVNDGNNTVAERGITVTVDGNIDIDTVTVGRKDTTQKDTLTVGGNVTTAKFFVEDKAEVSIKGDLNSNRLVVKSELDVGGKLKVDELSLNKNGTLTDTQGNPISGAEIGTLETKEASIALNDVTISKGVDNDGGTLTLQGTIGSKGAEASMKTQNGDVNLQGNAYLTYFDLKNGNLTVSETTYIHPANKEDGNPGWTQLVGDGSTKFTTKNLVFEGSGDMQAVDATIENITFNAVELPDGQFNQFQLVDIKDENKYSKLSRVKNMTINGNFSFFNQTEKTTLNIDRLVLNTTKANRFQSKNAMEFGEVEVNTVARIEGYEQDATLHAKKVTVAKDGHLTITSKIENVAGTIDDLTLMEGASFDNGIVKGETTERGYGAKLTKLTGINATITNLHGTLSIGDSAGKVDFTGTILDKNDGATLTLNDQSQWTVLNDSQVGNLTLAGGTTDLSTTDANVDVKQLTGKGGSVVMDATKTNTLTVKTTAKVTKLDILASENADKVTTSQAEAMVNRVEGVTNKTGHVEEGMYQGAITVNGQGQAAQAKNGLMADTLELASASTLSLNRILMNDVRKRLGDIRSAEAVNGVWARYDGGRLSGDGTKNKFNTIHIGGDTMPFAGTPVRVGMSASYTNGDVDYTRGNADMDAYSLAAYGTWLGDNGMFADVIARVAKAESDMTVDSVYKGKLKNTAYSLSGEFGWRFDLNSQFYAEPQVEATYTYIDSDKMTLAGKNETYNYEVEGFDSFIGRMGVLAGMKCPNQKGDVYVRASLVHEFLGDAKINGGANATLENEGKDTWFEYGIGANFNVGKNTYLWADLERTSGALVDEDVRGTLGVRFGF